MRQGHVAHREAHLLGAQDALHLDAERRALDADRPEKIGTVERAMPLAQEQVLEREGIQRLLERRAGEKKRAHHPPLRPRAMRMPERFQLGGAEHREDEHDVQV